MMSWVNYEISHICIIHLKISIFMRNTTHLKVIWLKNLMVSYSNLAIILATLNSLFYSKRKICQSAPPSVNRVNSIEHLSTFTQQKESLTSNDVRSSIGRRCKLGSVSAPYLPPWFCAQTIWWRTVHEDKQITGGFLLTVARLTSRLVPDQSRSGSRDLSVMTSWLLTAKQF